MPGMFCCMAHASPLRMCQVDAVSKSALVDAASLHTLTSAELVLLPIVHSVHHIIAHSLCWPS